MKIKTTVTVHVLSNDKTPKTEDGSKFDEVVVRSYALDHISGKTYAMRSSFIKQEDESIYDSAIKSKIKQLTSETQKALTKQLTEAGIIK